MSEKPWFSFYPNDWILDTRCLTMSAKGAWIDILAAMHHSKTRGIIAMNLSGWRRLFGGLTNEETIAILEELQELNVADITFEDVTQKRYDVTESNGKSNAKVTVINRRMVREDKQRSSNNLRQSAFRAKNKSNAKVTDLSRKSNASRAFLLEFKKKNKQKEKELSEAKEMLPISVPADVWEEWKKYRTEKRKTLTESTIKKQLLFLSKQSNPVAIIERSIQNGWIGLFKLDEEDQDSPMQNTVADNRTKDKPKKVYSIK